ncbi:golgin subfamily A member 3-like [Branchiostoma floridae]|uniref:Golgin subfamily A member 3-like n=1 Tax=Branchiostoma floridae TaxID=7739 RepID=A0A9J7N1Y7_BRAFL|nr:golgin subfamily A member 3-like [Branchiostoma floridae]
MDDQTWTHRTTHSTLQSLTDSCHQPFGNLVSYDSDLDYISRSLRGQSREVVQEELKHFAEEIQSKQELVRETEEKSVIDSAPLSNNTSSQSPVSARSNQSEAKSSNLSEGIIVTNRNQSVYATGSLIGQENSCGSLIQESDNSRCNRLSLRIKTCETFPQPLLEVEDFHISVSDTKDQSSSLSLTDSGSASFSQSLKSSDLVLTSVKKQEFYQDCKDPPTLPLPAVRPDMDSPDIYPSKLNLPGESLTSGRSPGGSSRGARFQTTARGNEMLRSFAETLQLPESTLTGSPTGDLSPQSADQTIAEAERQYRERLQVHIQTQQQLYQTWGQQGTQQTSPPTVRQSPYMFEPPTKLPVQNTEHIANYNTANMSTTITTTETMVEPQSPSPAENGDVAYFGGVKLFRSPVESVTTVRRTTPSPTVSTDKPRHKSKNVGRSVTKKKPPKSSTRYHESRRSSSGSQASSRTSERTRSSSFSSQASDISTTTTASSSTLTGQEDGGGTEHSGDSSEEVVRSTLKRRESETSTDSEMATLGQSLLASQVSQETSYVQKVAQWGRAETNSHGAEDEIDGDKTPQPEPSKSTDSGIDIPVDGLAVFQPIGSSTPWRFANQNGATVVPAANNVGFLVPVRLQQDTEYEQGVYNTTHQETVEEHTSSSSSTHNRLMEETTAMLREGAAKLQKALMEKAKLEGQLEMLSTEAETVMRERAELQSQLVELQKTLEELRTSGHGETKDTRALSNELQVVKQNKEHLEKMLQDLQLQLESKAQTIQVLNDELHAAHESNSKLLEKAEELKRELEGKETSLEEMKTQLSGLQVQLKEVQQERLQSQSELNVAQGDVESLVSAKDWFQEQLKFTQEARAQLQGELTTFQTSYVSQAAVVEQLKSDNANLRQQVLDTQQAAMKGKEDLAKHLEMIEAEMLSREAAFEQLQREKSAIEDTFSERLESIQGEKAQLSSIVSTVSELQHELENVKQELRRKVAAVNVLEREQRELVKRLTLTQECLAERDKSIETLQGKSVEAEMKLRAAQGDVRSKENEIQALREEKTAVEVALAAVQEEKRSFDTATKQLQEDMGKVDVRFRQMKLEVSTKAEQLELVQQEKNKLQAELSALQEELSEQQHHLETYNSTAAGKDQLVEELRASRVVLEGELSGLKQQLHELQENSSLKQKMADLQTSSHQELGKQKAKVLKLGTELNTAHQELQARQSSYENTVSLLSSKLQDAVHEKEQVEQQLRLLQGQFEQETVEQQGQLTSQLQQVHHELDLVRQRKDGIEKQMLQLQASTHSEIETYRQRIVVLERDLQTAREQTSELRRTEEQNQELLLQLERERGRLAGVTQSHSSLKQHASHLEAVLARRETSLKELSAQARQALEVKEAEDRRAGERVAELEAALKQERATSKDLRKQVAAKHSEMKRVEVKLKTLYQEKEELVQTFRGKDGEIERLQQELGQARQAGEQQAEDARQLRTRLLESRRHVERLQRQLNDKDDKEPVITDQIKNLQWQVDQREKEASALKEKLQLREKRHALEMDNMRAACQVSQKDLDSLRLELSSARKEKFIMQAKMSEMRAALKSSLKQNQTIKARLAKRSETEKPSVEDQASVKALSALEAIMAGVSLDVKVDETLLNPPSFTQDSKPLSILQSCLTTLRGEMSALQKQMDEHTATVINSTQAWRHVETQVQGLKMAVSPPTTPPKSPDISPPQVPFQGTAQGAKQGPPLSPPALNGVQTM